MRRKRLRSVFLGMWRLFNFTMSRWDGKRRRMSLRWSIVEQVKTVCMRTEVTEKQKGSTASVGMEGPPDYIWP
jgi:hypothetical protein